MTDVTLIPIIGAYCSQVYITENKEEFYLFFRMIGESQNKRLSSTMNKSVVSRCLLKMFVVTLKILCIVL